VSIWPEGRSLKVFHRKEVSARCAEMLRIAALLYGVRVWRSPFKPVVLGSSPRRPTNLFKQLRRDVLAESSRPLRLLYVFFEELRGGKLARLPCLCPSR
jgi:hypothetical protein